MKPRLITIICAAWIGLSALSSQTLAQQLLPKCVVRGNQKGLRSALWRAVGYEADTDIARFVRHL